MSYRSRAQNMATYTAYDAIIDGLPAAKIRFPLITPKLLLWLRCTLEEEHEL